MIYLISDLHLDHKNIIRYCKRPFSSADEMNRTIIDNWNEVINEDDFVYLVGDLVFGRKRTKIRYWLKKLKGNVNNKPEKYPFINGKNKTINVSVEFL